MHLRIAFDQQVFLLQEFGGISRYVCSLGEALSCIPEVTPRIFAPLHFNGHLQQAPRSLVRGRRAPRIPKTFRFVSGLSRHLADRAIAHFRPDIVHETYFSREFVGPRDSCRVITVYDMIAERYPAEFPGTDFTETKRESVVRADHVLCISESTRRDLVELFAIPVERTSVVYLGYDRMTADAERASGPVAPGGMPYLLYVGSRGGYKNFDSLLRAYAASRWLQDSCRIVCFGGGALASAERELIGALGIKQSGVVQLGGGDEVLADLYRHAAAFVYPSRYEGFGIPPLEAMSLDCPVLCSDTSSIPEVVGDAGEYFKPDDVDSLRVAIESMLQSPTRQDELIAKGRARCAAFSWERCARETLDIYRRLL